MSGPRKIAALVLLVIASIALFGVVFTLVHRPLVGGDIERQLGFKLAYARGLASPKVVILAGSNGRFSHRCEPLSHALGRPCVNASIGIGIGLDYQLERWLPLLRSGDIVYMPLEYDQYRAGRAEMEGGLQNALLVHGDRDRLLALGPRRTAAAYGSFDLHFLIHAVAEMALDARGFRRRASVDSLTPQGDERGHTAAAGAAYAEFLRQARFGRTDIGEPSHAQQVLRRFLQTAQTRGVIVVGGLPTVPDSVAVPDTDVDALRAVYERAGQRFVALPGRSRYPLSCFFDTLYHLEEACQIEHSRRVGEALSLLVPVHR